MEIVNYIPLIFTWLDFLIAVGMAFMLLGVLYIIQLLNDIKKSKGGVKQNGEKLSTGETGRRKQN